MIKKAVRGFPTAAYDTYDFYVLVFHVANNAGPNCCFV